MAGASRRTSDRALRRPVLRTLGYLLAWLVVAVPAALVIFFSSGAPMVVASHNAVVHPSLDHWARLQTGPYLPDFRTRVSGPVGVRIDFGKTNATSTPQLAARYTALATRPQAEIRRVQEVVVGLAWSAALKGAVVGLVPIGVWLLLGRERRAELARPSLTHATVAVGVVGLALVGVLQPWRNDDVLSSDNQWIPLQQEIPEVTVPAELARIQVQGGLITSETRRFITSGFDSFKRSTRFFQGIEDAAPTIADQLRRPESGQTLAVLVSDRHDNISMDAVVRKVADLAGATAVIDAGDDTSTGSPWESFSLDSLDEAFDGYDNHIAIAGNHDHGTFVSKYLKKLGWTHLDGNPVTEFGVRFTGVDDPRSSGLGSWRTTTGLSFSEVGDQLSKDVCKLDAEGRRVAVVVVHDANLAKDALARGCTDLVLAGHLHRQVGPERIVGENGKVGYRYTNGTTGGAAYAIAIASKLRREAEFTLVTFQDGRPVGLQPVKITPAGKYVVEPYVPLDLSTQQGEQPNGTPGVPATPAPGPLPKQGSQTQQPAAPNDGDQ